MDPWYMLQQIEGHVASLKDHASAERAGRLCAALAASISDVLLSPAKRSTLADGVRRASALLDLVRTAHEIDEASPAYLAGRLATMVDVLALIVRARAVDELPDLARTELKTLQALYQKPLSNVALAEERNITEEATCRSLRECRALNLVETDRVGRKNRNRLTPLAMALFDDGLLPIDDDQPVYNMESIVRRASGTNLVKGPDLPQLNLA